MDEKNHPQDDHKLHDRKKRLARIRGLVFFIKYYQQVILPPGPAFSEGNMLEGGTKRVSTFMKRPFLFRILCE